MSYSVTWFPFGQRYSVQFLDHDKAVEFFTVLIRNKCAAILEAEAT